MRSPSRSLVRRIALVSLLPSAPSCGAGEARGGGDLQGAVVVLLDTLRADHVSSYGYERATTPNLDRLAAQGVLFREVVSSAPWTLPSVSALLAADSPERGIFVDGRQVRSLVSDLAAAGVVTGAVTEGGYVSRAFGFDLGFDTFHEEEGEVRITNPDEPAEAAPGKGARHTFDLALEWLREHGQGRFFLLVHTYEPHTPYTERDFAEGLSPGRVGPALSTRFLGRIRSGEVELTQDELAYTVALYDSDIHKTDRELGRFVEELAGLGLADRTLLVVTSDHGEELGEHYPRFTADHGHSLRDNLLLVPLVVHDPTRAFAVRDVGLQVRLLDVLPTVADLLDIPLPGGHEGRSLVPLMLGDEVAERLAFAGRVKAGPPRFGVRAQGFKFILSRGEAGAAALEPRPARAQLYDLGADPGERVNVAGERPELRRTLKGLLDEHARGLAAPVDSAPDEELDAQLLERLRSLGYAR